MTVVCKRRSRLSGRPQASFGSFFTSVLAPTINAGASVLDSSLSKHSAEKQTSNTEPKNDVQTDNTSTPKVDVESIKNLNVPNPVEKPLQFNQEIVQSDPTKARLGAKVGQRHKCWIGAAIGAATSIAGSLFGNAAQKKQMRAQQRMQDYNNAIQEAQGMTQSLNGSSDAQEAYLKQFRTAARFGKNLGNGNIVITDGGNAQPVDKNTFLLRGGSHEDINETGQTGIGINVGGNQIEAEGGEVAQKKDGALRIFSAQPILSNGMSPAQAILRGYNKDKVFAAQQRFKRNNHLKDDGSKFGGGGYADTTPSPLDILRILYDKTLGRFDNKNPNLITGIAPTPGRGKITNLGQVKSGLRSRSMLPTNKVYRITNAREVSDAKQFGQYRKMPDNISLPSKVVKTRTRRSFDLGKTGGNTHGGKAASMGEPWNGTTSSGIGEQKYIISTPNRYTNWQVGHHGRYSETLPAESIKKGSGLFKRFNDDGTTGISTKRMKVYKPLTNGLYKVINKNKFRNGGKVYTKPNYYNWMHQTSDNLKVSPIDSSYDYRAYYDSATPWELAKTMYDVNNGHFTDIGKRPSHPTFSNESKYNNSKTPGGNWDGNVFVPSIWQFGNDGNKKRNNYMNNTGEGYFDGKRNVYPRNKYSLGGVRKKAKIGTNIGINTNINIPDYNSAYINWLISQLPNKQNEQQVVNYNQEDIDNAMNAANLAYQNYLIRQLPSGKSNKQQDDKQNNNSTTSHMTVDDFKRNSQSIVDASRRAVDFANNTYRSKLISQLPPKDRRSLKDKTQSIVDATRFAVDNVINYKNSKIISQLPNKQNNKENNKVAKRQVKTTPKYKGNVTKGNYQLHDGESKIINGIKYTRMGNTIINHKTNVGYIYDKNGNYTGQADYSKVGNFNQAFDAARAAGRTNFIYRAGKYNNYSTVKETNAKKEALNRKVGAKRIAKRYGGIEFRPVKGMYGSARPKAKWGFNAHTNNSIVPIYDFSGLNDNYDNHNNYDNRDNYDYDFGNALGDKEVFITAKGTQPTYMKPNDDALNLLKAPKKEEVPYIPQTNNRSRTIFSGGDYIGLGIDTLAALSTGLINYNTAGKYVLPDRAPIIQASKLPTTYNIAPQLQEIKRMRDRLSSSAYNNTSSSVAALNRDNNYNASALTELDKLYATKENEETKMLTEDAKNQQSVAIQNAQNELARQSEIARIKNESIQAKGEALNVGLSGLSQAWTNFWTAGRTAYEDDQARRAMIASSKEASPTRLAEMGYNLSPDLLASLYKTSTDDRTKRYYLSRLSPKQRIKYGIN